MHGGGLRRGVARRLRIYECAAQSQSPHIGGDRLIQFDEPVPKGEAEATIAKCREQPLRDYAEENRNAMWPPLTNIWQNANGTQGTQTQSSAVAQSGATGGSLAPITSMTQPQSIPAESLQYMNGFCAPRWGVLCRWIFWSGPTALLHAPGFSWPLGQILSSSTRRKRMISLPVIFITSSSSVSIINRKWKTIGKTETAREVIPHSFGL